MAEELIPSSQESFGDLPDPRVKGRCDHKLIDMIVLAVCAVICGADSWVGVEIYGKEKEAFLREQLELPNGIPSHDTLGRVFAALDAEVFESRFARWVEGVFELTDGQVVAIDGQTARRSHDRGIGRDAIHLVSACPAAMGSPWGSARSRS